MVKCSNCTGDVPASERNCPACGADNGFPNVRLAAENNEVDELNKRVNQAEVSARAGEYIGILEEFGNAVLKSKAVIARSLGVVQNLLESHSRTYANYYGELAGGARMPEDNEFDPVRIQIEGALFPNFHEQIRFAALSLNNLGLSSFGPYVMVLREEMIAHRASVFEENPVVFVDRHGIYLGQPIPPGYRATWQMRGELAKAKLYPKLSKSTVASEFPLVLMDDNVKPKKSDYIEVHIFGTFNCHSVEKILGPRPRTREDRLIWRKLDKMISESGGTLETI